MNLRQAYVAVGVAGVAALVLGFAMPGPPWEEGRGINDAQSVTVAWDAPLFSVNTATVSGNATANAVITSMTGSSFWYYDENAEIRPDPSFGTYELVSEDPLTVTYTFAEENHWSDGVPVTAADLLLEWAATSGHFNSVDVSTLELQEDGSYHDEAGNPVDTSAQVVFNAANPGRAAISEFPTMSADGREITFVYDVPRADWLHSFSGPTVPAHIVAQEALGIADPETATAALVAAFRARDASLLAPIAEFWNTGFDFTSMPDNPNVLVSNGAYTITSYVAAQYLTLSRNEEYRGDRHPAMDKVTVRYITDPMGQVSALRNGEVDVVAPQATADVRQAVEQLGDRVVVDLSDEAVFEQITMNFLPGSPFSPDAYGGDEEAARLVRTAFLLTIPRQRIVNTLIAPLNSEAVVRNSLLLIPGSPGYPAAVARNGSAEFQDAGDVARARELLEQAGVSAPVRVRFSFNGDNTRRANQFVLIRESAAQAGFDVVDASAPAASFSQMLSGGRDAWDATLFAWASTSTAVTGNDTTYRTGGSNNHGSYSSHEVDSLFNALAEEPDADRQLEIQIEIEKVLWHDGVSLSIFQFPAISAWNSHLTGIQPSVFSPFVFAGFWNWEEK